MFLVLVAGLTAIAYAGFLAVSVLKLPSGSEKMQEIASAVRQGSMAYLKRQYSAVSIFAVVLAIVLGSIINIYTAVGFVLGAFLSALAGFIGMNISVRANVRTAEAAKAGLNHALGTAFKGGAVTGFAVVGLGLLGVTALYLTFGDPLLIIGFGFGASLISLFARVGGGIYTKAADVGADLVGKVEAGIPEDDLRNPAVIADNVGDNVGDCAGMAADLFETYVVTTIAAMILGLTLVNGVIYPLMLGAVAIFASIIGSFFVRVSAKEEIMNGLYKALIVSALLSAAGFYYITINLFGNLNLFYASLTGLAIAVAINIITDYFTSKKYSPVRSIADASQTGAGTNVITGLAVGLKSTILPAIVICAGLLAAYYLSGLYGIAIAAVAMLSLTGIIVAIDSYGPITDNAGGIAEMADLPAKTRAITDRLDAVGNTTKAVTKGYAIGSAALATLALFSAYTDEISKVMQFSLSINDPAVLIGLFLGGAITFLFSAFCMSAVGSAAQDVVKEVRRQFADGKIMKGRKKPDYARCVDIVTRAAQRELLAPGLIAVVSPLAVGFLLGAKALGGLLIGSIVTGLLLAIQMTSGGAAWDNAKKFIEASGKKGTDEHKAAVVGDTVGDPFKDTAGPAINPLIKVMNIIALLFAQLIAAYAIFAI